MPHAAYRNANVWCPWPGCGYRIELIDFQLELGGNPPFYSQVMINWGLPGYGLIGQCPGCRQYVLFRPSDKQPFDNPNMSTLPLLPDDWPQHAFVV